MPTVWTNAGQAQAVDLLDPATRSGVPTTYFGGWGTGVTAPVVANTALETPAAEARVSCTVSQPNAETVRYAFSITATGTKSISEVGVFDASTAGTLIVRSTFTAVSVISGDVIAFNVDVPVKDISE